MSEGVPAGWALVPVEPTQEMVMAACVAIEMAEPSDLEPADPKYFWGCSWMTSARDAWSTMLAATPTPPPSRDADVERVSLAKSLYWADVKLSEDADRIQDEWLDRWWTECSTMPLSGPGFLRKWFALADAALQALGERG